MDLANNTILVTGSSKGLGRAFAHALAAEGAQVVVNSHSNPGGGQRVADEIVAAGGTAIHINEPVTNAKALVEKVQTRCGALHAVVHNAGIVQDKSLAKMSAEQWHSVLDVHLTSAFALTQAAWPQFAEQGHGRLVFLSSASGLYGNFGQANYAAAKAGMYGLCRTIAIEGAKANIRANCVAPFGATTMNGANLPEELKAIIKPEYIAPLIGYLCHGGCEENGSLFEASGGVFKKVRWQRSRGARLDVAQPLSIQALADQWADVTNFDDPDYPSDMGSALHGLYANQKNSDR